jgi:predicted porin
MFAKKTLVAAAAMIAAMGAAQAETSLKVYGMLDVGMSSMDAAHAKGSASRVTLVDSGNMMTSYIGFGGSEDLGGGLKAEFALESFIGVDTGKNVANNAGYLWSRGSSVALSGGFGKVALGQYDNPLFTSGYTYNPFGSSMAFSPTMRHFNYIGQTVGIAGAGVGFDTGWVNSVTYESPAVAGFSAVLQASAKEATGSANKNSYAASGSYNAGPLSATLTYVKGGKTTAPSLTAYTADEKVWDLGASYDFGVVKAFAQYTDINDSTNANKDKIYQLGVSVPVTEKASVLASFGGLKNKVSATGATTKDEVFALGYDYVLSKRTDVYGVIMNNRQSTLESGQSVAVGIKHNF